jgi:membrane protein YqaA with SNARE-associated domain
MARTRIEWFRKKLTFAVFAFLVLYMIYIKWSVIVGHIPVVSSIYSFVYANLAEKTVAGMFWSSFFGALFFIFLPVEFIFVYYFDAGYNLALLVLVVLAGNVLGLVADYFLGIFFGEKLARKLMKKKYDFFVKLVVKFGAFFILVGNALVIPVFPIEPFSFIVGSSRYSFKKFMVYTVAGKAVQLALLAYLLVKYGHSLLDFSSLKSIILG